VSGPGARSPAGGARGHEHAERSEVELPAVPGLGRLYARALTGAGLRAARRPRPVSSDLPARTLVVQGVRADADRLTAYQHLLGEPANDRLPAGFVHVLAFPLAMDLITARGFPLPALGLVHVANRIVQHRTALLGDRLTLTARAEHLHSHRAGTAVDLVTEAIVDHEVVWTGTSTYLAKGVRVRGDAPDSEPPPPFVVPAAPTAQWRLPADRGRAYAAVSGDRNPIHLSAPTARLLGFPRAIAHGMDTAARLLAAVGPARGEAFTWSVEFAAPVLLPSTVDVRVAADDGGFSLAAWRPKDGKPQVVGRVAVG
jgi:acyl dehydratase